MFDQTDNKCRQAPDRTLVGYPESDGFVPELEEAVSFLAYCRKVKKPGEFGSRSDFDAERLLPWLGYIMILDHVPEASDFRYRMYGTAIAQESGFDMTGKLVSDFHSDTGQFFLDLYREAVARRAIICSVNGAVHAQYSCDWHRVLCPVIKGDAVQIVACNYPVARREPSM